MQLQYHGYWNHTGYSIAAQDYVLAMRKARPEIDIKIHYLNTVTRSGMSDNRFQLFQSFQKVPTREPFMNLFHSIPQRYRRHRDAKKHVGFCIFETVNPPKDWINRMNEMDEIITASAFNQNMFKANGCIKPVHVVPHCFDPNMFNKDVRDEGRYNLRTFISVGTWKTRKNWETLIKAFYDAFEKKDNVCLLIKTDKPQDLKSLVMRTKRNSEWRAKDTAPVYAEEKSNCKFEDIPKIMKKGDIYINASLGEGFGIPIMHAMALGLPVITPRFGGALEYAKPETCTYIEPSRYKTHPVMDGIPQFSNCIWPVISIGEVRDKMIEVLNNPPIEKTKMAYKYVHTHLTHEVIGKRMIEVLGI